jgi:hypothetical protein
VSEVPSAATITTLAPAGASAPRAFQTPSPTRTRPLPFSIAASTVTVWPISRDARALRLGSALSHPAPGLSLRPPIAESEQRAYLRVAARVLLHPRGAPFGAQSPSPPMSGGSRNKIPFGGIRGA